MKKYTIFFMAAALCMAVFTGCKDKNGSDITVKSSIVGEWQLSEWNGEQAVDFSIYMRFKENGHFDLYQKVTTSYFELYEGQYRISSDGLLTGRYSDGQNWNESYDFTLSDSDRRLTLVSRSDSHVVSVYVRTQIPDDLLVQQGRSTRAGSDRML